MPLAACKFENVTGGSTGCGRIAHLHLPLVGLCPSLSLSGSTPTALALGQIKRTRTRWSVSTRCTEDLALQTGGLPWDCGLLLSSLSPSPSVLKARLSPVPTSCCPHTPRVLVIAEHNFGRDRVLAGCTFASQVGGHRESLACFAHSSPLNLEEEAAGSECFITLLHPLPVTPFSENQASAACPPPHIFCCCKVFPCGSSAPLQHRL